MSLRGSPEVDKAPAALVRSVDVALVDAAGLQEERQRALAKDLRDASVVVGIHLFGREQRGLVGGEVIRVDRDRQEPVTGAAGVVDPHPDRLDAELGQRHSEMPGHLLVRGNDELYGHVILSLRLDTSSAWGLIITGRRGCVGKHRRVVHPASDDATSSVAMAPAVMFRAIGTPAWFDSRGHSAFRYSIAATARRPAQV
jgi:hypothetical protein